MKQFCLAILVFVLCVSSYASSESAFRDIPVDEVQTAFNRPIQPHPRLFITNEQLLEIRNKIKSQPLLQVFYQIFRNYPINQLLNLLPSEKPLSSIARLIIINTQIYKLNFRRINHAKLTTNPP